ncbi:hypothetical protein LLEC1_05089 [Akanthomyces lecanii]|uniref:Uncharacterized protein n=1 Tax=Cordyceps confragosa TaxID=2714763 RepID=A0A179IDF6_CORDF|nr:hypothetical protein LLEC1_05089 [Akanthomyces lecanii]
MTKSACKSRFATARACSRSKVETLPNMGLLERDRPETGCATRSRRPHAVMDKARAVGHFLINGIKDKGFPLPDTIYTSHLLRCLATAKVVFEVVPNDQIRPFKPEFKELFGSDRLTTDSRSRSAVATEVETASG